MINYIIFLFGLPDCSKVKVHCIACIYFDIRNLNIDVIFNF